MNNKLIYGLAAALGVGGGVALFLSMGDSGPSAPEAPTEQPQVELVAPAAEGQVEFGAEKKPPPPERELRETERRLKEQLEGPWGMHTRTAGPAWNAVAYDLAKAGLDVDAAKAKEMGLAITAEMRNERADIEALVADERALVAQLRGGPAGPVVEEHLVRIEGLIAELEAPPEDGE